MTPCPICTTLADRESATQKFGWPENDTALPPAIQQLAIARDFRPGSERKRQILQCPRCGTCYLYETDYEYLTNGTEDEQTLVRLTPEHLARLQKPESEKGPVP